MDIASRLAEDQAALWNNQAGRAWIDAQDVVDRMFQPLEDALVAAVRETSSRRVLDVGCGTGGTTLAIARALGEAGAAVGVDISAPMLAAARDRAGREGSRATFIVDDAQRHEFEPGWFDAVVSRFGVMFFEDTVHAFANLRSAARSGAALRCITWRSPEENPFMTTAERAAAPLLPNLPARQCATGQFAFADRGRVERILEVAGWREIESRRLDVTCALTESELAQYLPKFGPLGRIMPELDAQTRAHVIGTVRAAFEPFVRGGVARFDAACWMLCARA